MVGLLLGYGLQLLFSQSIYLYDIGVLFTMLIIGNHLEMKTLKKYRGLTIMILLGTILMIVINTLIISSILNTTTYTSFIISTCLCLSSTLICQNVLESNNATSTNYGKTTIIATIAQDIIGIILLSFLHLNIKDIHSTSLHHFIFFIILLIYIFFNEKIISLINDIVTGSKAQKMYNIKISFVIICLLVSNMILVPQEITYFIIGVLFKTLVSDAKYEITFIQVLSMIALFAYAGNILDIVIIQNNIIKIFELLFLTTFIKIFTLYTSIILIDQRFEPALRSTILLSTCSELTLFVISIINVDKSILNIVIATTTLSMIINPVLFNMLSRAIDQIQQRNIGIAKYAARVNINHLTKYILAIGYNKVTKMFLTEASSLLTDIVIIDHKLEKVLENSKNCYFMDALSDETYQVIDIDKLYCIIIFIKTLSIKLNILNKIKHLNLKSKNIRIYVPIAKEDINSLLDKGDNIVPIIVNNLYDYKLATDILKNIQEDIV
jgi:Kef-type K+ transport system membrane component KefB